MSLLNVESHVFNVFYLVLFSIHVCVDDVIKKSVKENLTGCLDITPAWKPNLVSGKCFFFSTTDKKTLLHYVLMGCFLSYIAEV